VDPSSAELESTPLQFRVNEVFSGGLWKKKETSSLGVTQPPGTRGIANRVVFIQARPRV
jgi:hypothetical protein